MNIPAYANPGLGELLQPGMQRNANIHQDAAAFDQTASKFPAAMDRYQAGKSAQEESNRNNRDVTPWEKAAARLLAGHDPKAVAADTKAELAGQPAGISGAAPQMAQIQTSPGSLAMPAQMGGGRMGMGAMGQPAQPAVPPTYNQVPVNSLGGGPQQPQGMQGGQPAVNSDDMFKGMNHRDWGEYISALEKGKLAQNNRDYLAEIAARGAQEQKTQEVRNSGNESTAKIKAGATINGQNLRADAQELDRRVKEKSLDERTAHNIANIQLGYAKLKMMSENLDKSLGTKDKLEGAKILQRHADALQKDAEGLEASLTGLAGGMNVDVKAHAAEIRAAAVEAMGRADQIIKKNEADTAAKAATVHQTKTTQPAGAQSPKKPEVKVGDKVTLKNGTTMTIKIVHPDGSFD